MSVEEGEEDINDIISKAIEVTNYNESIQLDINQNKGKENHDDDDDNDNDLILLMPKLDKKNGGILWNNVFSSSSTKSKKDILLSYHFRTKSWIIPMLNDKKRNTLYKNSINNACYITIQNKIKKKKLLVSDDNDNVININVLDIGSGTGLLAMISCYYLLKYQKEYAATTTTTQYKINFNITSLEMSDAMVILSKDIIKYNRLDNYITILNQHSSEYDFLTKDDNTDSSIDIITCELLDTTVVGEGIISCLYDILSRIPTTTSPIIIPNRLKVYGVVLSGDKSILSCKNDIFGNTQHVSVRAPTFMKQDDIIQLSNTNLLLLDINFTSFHTLKESLNNTTALANNNNTSFICTNDGIAHGIIFYFEFELLPSSLKKGEGEECYSYNTWDEIYTQDHWRHCLYIFDTTNNNSVNIHCYKDKEYNISTFYNNNLLSFTIHEPKQTQMEESMDLNALTNRTTSISTTISPQRILQLNDSSYLSHLYNNIQNIYEQYSTLIKNDNGNKIKTSTTTIVDLSDYGICAMLASKLRSKTNDTHTINVHSIQTKLYSLHIPSSVHIHHMYPDQIIHNYITLFNNKPIDILLNEPYLSKLDGWDVLQSLNLYYTIRGLVSKDNNEDKSSSLSETSNTSTTTTTTKLFSPNVIVYPQKAFIMSCIIQFDLFSNAYNINLSTLFNNDNDISSSSLLDHTLVNLYTSAKNDILLPLWQYDYKILTDPFCLHTLDYQQLARPSSFSSSENNNNGDNWVQVPFIKEGVCHALLTWVEYNTTTTNSTSSSSSWSSLHKNHLQSIRILPNNIKNKIIKKEDIHKMNYNQKYILRCKMTLVDDNDDENNAYSSSLDDEGREYNFDFEHV